MDHCEHTAFWKKPTGKPTPGDPWNGEARHMAQAIIFKSILQMAQLNVHLQ